MNSQNLTEEGFGFSENPLNTKNEDIYDNNKLEESIDPEDISLRKENKKKGELRGSNEKGFLDDETGEDLDIPGAELDDDEEKIGSEDEENNYYSLGGDNHDNLEEDNGD